MLTGDLLRVRVVKKEIRLSLVDPDRGVLQERARELLELWQRGVDEGLTRAELNDAVKEIIGDGIDHKLTRGLARVLERKSEYGTDAPMPPLELRQKLFAAVAQAPSRAAAQAAYQAVADALDSTPQELERVLYADRKEEQIIQSVDVPDPAWILQRYNVALVQSVLMHATQVQVTLESPGPERLRQLMRHVRFNQLMYRARRVGSDVELVLDGPASLVRLNTRYGRSLSRWFPALLLQVCGWKLHADLRWGKRRLRKVLTLDHDAGLTSHYKDTGAYVTRTEQWLMERWARLETDWTLTREPQVLDLKGQGVVCPAFTLRKGRRVAYLEIAGMWRKDWLIRHHKNIQTHGPGNLILAVSSKLAGDKGALGALPGPVVPFKEIVPAKDVLAWAERVARAPRRA